MKEINEHPATIAGLPRLDEKHVPEFFKCITTCPKPFYKWAFVESCGMYFAMQGYPVLASADAVRIVLIKDKNNNPIMYAYIFNNDDPLTLMEIGEMPIYEVKKDQVIVEDVEYHRLAFAELRDGGFAIMVRGGKDESSVTELWQRSANGEENKLDFQGGSLKEGLNYLKEKKLI